MPVIEEAVLLTFFGENDEICLISVAQQVEHSSGFAIQQETNKQKISYQAMQLRGIHSNSF